MKHIFDVLCAVAYRFFPAQALDKLQFELLNQLNQKEPHHPVASVSMHDSIVLFFCFGWQLVCGFPCTHGQQTVKVILGTLAKGQKPGVDFQWVLTD